MAHAFSRTEMIFGALAMEKIYAAKVVIFGVGGVGSFAAEALARSGVGHFIFVDNDTVSITNVNRQIHATTKTIGRYKTHVMKERILEINPLAHVKTYEEFYLPQSQDVIDGDSHYVIDAVDTVTAKIEIILQAKQKNIPIISSMGTGNKVSPQMLLVDDIYRTSVCPLAKVMRHELKKRGVQSLKVVYSKEKPLQAKMAADEDHTKKNIPGSVSFVPSCAGLIIAGEVIKELAGDF